MSGAKSFSVRGTSLVAAAAACVVAGLTGSAQAAPFASSPVIAGNNVSFILNEPADLLTVSVNGGAPQVLDGSTKGTKNFTISSPSDTFSIIATKTDTVGYTIPTSGTTPASANGLSQTTNNGGFRLVSDDTNVLGRFNSPRGVTVNNQASAGSLFGTVYVANSAAGTAAAGTGTGGTIAGAPARTLTGDGLYALKADETDATGNGNAASTGPATWTTPATASAPFRVSVGRDNNVYVADFADTSSVVGFANPTLTSYTQALAGTLGPSALPPGQNHGSITAIASTGSLAGGNLSIYTLDEDLTDAQFGGANATAKNNLWRYDIGSGSLPSNVTPVRINQTSILLNAATSDFEIGADGKFYVAQNRAAGAETGLYVLDSGGNVVYNSLTASGGTTDILRNLQGISVSPDQKYLAAMLNNSDVVVIPLVNGIPDLNNRLLVDTGIDINSGRDIAFDAADNIHYVSSGQAIYRVLSPGGATSYALNYNGSQYSFNAVVPEPTSLALLAGVGSLLAFRRRRSI